MRNNNVANSNGRATAAVRGGKHLTLPIGCISAISSNIPILFLEIRQPGGICLQAAASSANLPARRLTNCRQRARGYALWKPGATGKESFEANNLFTAYTLNTYPYRVCVFV